MSVDHLIALPLPGAARLAGVSPRRLAGWAAIDLVKPAVERRLSERVVIRLYGFQELTELAVVALLLKHKVSMKHVREVLTYLHQAEQALSECRFAIDPDTGRLFFDPDGRGWSASNRPAQIMLPQVIPLDEIRNELRRRLAERPAALAGRTEKRRGTLGSKEVFAGTRIPVDTIVGYFRRGLDAARIQRSFPTLSEADIEVARRRAV